MNTNNTPRKFRNMRADDVLKELSMKFVALQSNGTSLVTVTNVAIEDRGKNMRVLFTVLPEDKEAVVLDFLKRKRVEFREYIKAESRLGVIPFVDFEIDLGEKNRQTVDRLV